MLAYHANLGAGIDGLSVREHDVPEPGLNQALVRVRACSLSFRELMILRGWYPLPIKPDLIPVSDGAGEVVALGERARGVAVGDRVCAAIFPRWLDGPYSRERSDQLGGSLDGMLAEYAVVDADALVPIPDHLSFEQASCLPCVGVTAWNALTGLRAGETVVTLGSGGVSLFALQLAKASGARVIATTSSERKAERLGALGADEVVVGHAAWHEPVHAFTGGRGADRVVHVGGSLDESLKAVAVGGEVAYVGLLSSEAPVDPRVLFASVAVVRVVAVGSRAQFAALTCALAANRLEPVVDRVFGFDEAQAAYRYYEAAQPLGKVVITLRERTP